MVNIVDHHAGSKFVFSRYVSRIAMIPCSGAKHPALGIVRGQCRSSSCCSVLRANPRRKRPEVEPSLASARGNEARFVGFFREA